MSGVVVVVLCAWDRTVSGPLGLERAGGAR